MVDTIKRLNINVPEELHRMAKATAAQTGTTLGAFVAAAIAEKVDREKKEQKG